MAKRIITKHETLRLTENAFAGGFDQLVAIYEVELYGLLQHMPATDEDGPRMAIFGSFERTENGTTLYSATVWADHGVIFHDYHSEFLDDLAYLQAA